MIFHILSSEDIDDVISRSCLCKQSGRKVDNAIPQINHYPVDSVICFIKQLLDEVEHDIMNYQNWGLCYLPKPKAETDNTDTRFW